MKLSCMCQKVVFELLVYAMGFDMWWFIYALAICSARGINYIQNESLFKKTFVSSKVWPPSVHISKVSSLYLIY